MATFSTPIGCMRVGWNPYSGIDEVGSRSGVAKCLNIQYASIPYRWAAPREAKLPWAGVRDCTRFGPGCPQRHEPLFNVKGVPLFGIQGSKSLSVRPETEDEFNCLNLNIYMPATITSTGSVQARQNLPVFLWIHGGAYLVGSGNVDAYDGVGLVTRSVRTDMPMIAVTVNYRLGILGFFHSSDLVGDAAAQQDVPAEFRSTGNLGLVDAFYAVQWVKKNIAHFGGDPDNITAIGESAGAAIIHYLVTVPALQVHIPRIILSSSTVCSNPVMRAHTAQNRFREICNATGIVESCDAVRELRKMDLKQLIEKTKFAESSFRPVWDGITIVSDPREVLFDPNVWDKSLTDVIMGVCRNEAWMRKAESLEAKPNFEALIRSRVPPDPPSLRERGRCLYNDTRNFDWFDSPDGSEAEHRTHVAFEGHMRYYAPAHLVAESFIKPRGYKKPHSGSRLRDEATRQDEGKKRTLFRYLLSWTTSQFPAGWPVTHTADILPTFLHRSLSSEEYAVACSFVDCMLAFISGRKERIQWEEYTGDQKQTNELTPRGTWQVANHINGGFDLTHEYLDFVTSVLKASIEAGR